MHLLKAIVLSVVFTRRSSEHVIAPARASTAALVSHRLQSSRTTLAKRLEPEVHGCLPGQTWKLRSCVRISPQAWVDVCLPLIDPVFGDLHAHLPASSMSAMMRSRSNHGGYDHYHLFFFRCPEHTVCEPYRDGMPVPIPEEPDTLRDSLHILCRPYGSRLSNMHRARATSLVPELLPYHPAIERPPIEEEPAQDQGTWAEESSVASTSHAAGG